MKEIIQYFNEVCINELLKVSENLYRDPSKFAEYIEETRSRDYQRNSRRDGYGNKKQCKKKDELAC